MMPAAGPPKCKLPDLTHLKSSDYQNVYEPSDDTFLLVDALAQEAAHADSAPQRGPPPLLCVEVGSGSGTVVTHLGLLSRDAPANSPRRSVALMATELNPLAATATAATAAVNGVRVHAIHMDLLSSFRRGVIDMIIFNPPYVPTSIEECVDGAAARDISAAWAGGPRGRLVLDRLLRELRSLLAPNGLFYLLGVKENEPEELGEMMGKEGFTSETIAQRRAQNERLFVMRFSRGA